jgi:hypothetical protein
LVELGFAGSRKRYFKTGGPAMLSMMNRAVNYGDPTTMLISWTIRLLNHRHWSNGTTAPARRFDGVACGFFDNLAGYAQCSPRSPLRVAWQATESATSLDVNGALTTSEMNESSSSFGHDAVNSVN